MNSTLGSVVPLAMFLISSWSFFSDPLCNSIQSHPISYLLRSKKSRKQRLSMRRDWSSRRLQSCSPRRLRTSFKSNLDIFLRELELGWEFAKNVSQNPERQIITHRCGWPTSLSCLLRRAKSGWPSQPRLHQGDRKHGLPIVLCCIENIQLLETKFSNLDQRVIVKVQPPGTFLPVTLL